MMTPRKKLFIILGAFLLLFLLVLLWWLLSRKTTVTQEPPREIPPITVIDTPTIPPSQVAATNERVGTSSLQTLAKTFTARFGSYSTDTSGENLIDLLPLMTTEFAESTRQQVARAEKSSEYYGVSTRVVAVTVVESGDTEATLSVSTQREESKGSPQNTSIKYQTLVLKMVKIGENWFVSEAAWE